MAGWRPALRLARRDALRNRGRSILVLVMIALPVLAVSAADVVYKTSDVSGAESLDRRLGAADARITVDESTGRVVQGFDPDNMSSTSGGGRHHEPADLEQVRSVLGRDVPATERRDGGISVDTERGVLGVEVTEQLDPASPLVDGLFRLTGGTWPASAAEVVVNDALAAKGFPVGSELTVHDGKTLTVVGTAESTSYRNYPVAVEELGALGIPTIEGSATWLVGGGPVSWEEVRSLNKIGATVLSRSVVEDPPPDSELPAQLQQWQTTDDAYVAALVLVVVMVLLEVVLLAGPAFAVGARRQQRTLALMAASGGTPRQARQVILAGGVVLGATAAVLGVALGVLTGWALLPVVQHYSDSWLGPFEVAPTHLLGVAAFGLVSALLAAVVPAYIASRQDVVAVLAGRRGDRKPGYRSPIVGLVLLLCGVGLAAFGARQSGGEVLIAAAAVVSVLGMILLVPVVVTVLARFSRRLPLVTRYAVRDAARHRTRTVPAVAAVAATVAGVVALGIANSSDAAESEATYEPSMPMGMGMLSVAEQDVDWTRFEKAIALEAPSVHTTQVTSYDAYRDDVYYDVRVRRPDVSGYDILLNSWGAQFGNLLAGKEMLALADPADPDDLGPARQMLEQGGLVVFTSEHVDGDTIHVGGTINPAQGGKPTRIAPVDLPAYFLQIRGPGPALAIAPPGALDATGLTASTAGLLLDAHDLGKADEDDLREVIQGVSDNAYLYVERGYQQDDATMILLAILFSLGAVLMLGGTLTATFLALSDARPDLATLSAVGAAPRARRGVAASYALFVGLVGAALGAAVGFIPGIAISYPLTSGSASPGDLDSLGVPLPSHFIDIPWAFVLGLVVLLPLLTALIVGLTARSRLPLVARLD